LPGCLSALLTVLTTSTRQIVVNLAWVDKQQGQDRRHAQAGDNEENAAIGKAIGKDAHQDRSDDVASGLERLVSAGLLVEPAGSHEAQGNCRNGRAEHTGDATDDCLGCHY